VVAVRTYKVTAKRWAHGWELHIAGVGVTQSRSLSDAEDMVRDYISLDLEVPPNSFAVAITPEVGGDLDAKARQVRQEIREAAEAQQRAAARSREIARLLKAKGLSGRDIAAVLGVSAQRVSQLLADETRKSA